MRPAKGGGKLRRVFCLKVGIAGIRDVMEPMEHTLSLGFQNGFSAVESFGIPGRGVGFNTSEFQQREERFFVKPVLPVL
jgi:hypothetical protein